MQETREEREARKGGENEVRGSIDAQRALKKPPLRIDLLTFTEISKTRAA